MSTEQDKIHRLLPERDFDSNIDIDAIRQSTIESIDAEEQRQRMKARIAGLKRSKLNGLAHKEKSEELKAEIEKARLDRPVILVKKGEVALTGTSSVDVVKMLQKLNINLNMQLTRSDTMNLLATLLTCNERQLTALSQNPKVPIAVKIVIKRLLEDSKVGNMEAIEKLWDRVFGKAAMTLEPPPGTASMNGIIPNTPVSRETYMVIRDTYLGQG